MWPLSFWNKYMARVQGKSFHFLLLDHPSKTRSAHLRELLIVGRKVLSGAEVVIIRLETDFHIFFLVSAAVRSTGAQLVSGQAANRIFSRERLQLTSLLLSVLV